MPEIKDDPESVAENDDIRRRFFELLFRDATGYLCLALANKEKQFEEQAYFKYPDQLTAALNWITDRISREKHLYFSPMLYRKKHRLGANVSTCPVLWADCDTADPYQLERYQPSIVVDTSPGRTHAYWYLREPAEPQAASMAARRLAHALGADPSGYELGQVLRIPLTYNAKYEGVIVKIRDDVDEADITTLILEDIDLPEVPLEQHYDVAFPVDDINRLDFAQVATKYRGTYSRVIKTLHDTIPNGDWSKTLWNLETLCLENGMSREETFVIAETAKCNKYARDNRPREDLWKEVCKAYVHVAEQGETYEEETISIPTQLLKDEERDIVAGLEPTFVDDYVKWAKSRTDAAAQYHEAGAFVVLSAVLADSIRLDLSLRFIPNLWFMLLGDTTLTRKTTAMEMAMDLLNMVYDDAVLATDASMEGLLTALSKREGMTSVFWRDEFSGLLDQMKRKDYYSGMSAAFARLYDGKRELRVLKQATYEVRNPVFLMFCGGIKSRILELFNTDYVVDGFIPRFIYVVAEPNIDELKPLGMRTEIQDRLSGDFVERLSILRGRYDTTQQINVSGQTMVHNEPHLVTMTQEALDRYNELEFSLIGAARETPEPDLYVPTMDRFAKSGLRVATLLAAERQKPPDVVVELQDILQALKYMEGWLPHSLMVVSQAGKGVSERTLEKALALIVRGRSSRGGLMRSMKLSARDADWILETLEQRGHIIRTKAGRGERIFPSHVNR